MDIDIFVQPLNELINDDFENLIEKASPFRQNKINSHKQLKNKNLCLGATLLLDKALKKYDLSERDMEYSLNEYGKPYFSNHSEIYFNISHSGDYVLVVLSSDEVGCDIQQVTNVNLKIADRFFTAKECEYIKNIDNFFRVWALKESFIKFIGKGLSQPLNSFSIEGLDDEPYVIYNGEKYAFIENKINDYVISICKKVK